MESKLAALEREKAEAEARAEARKAKEAGGEEAGEEAAAAGAGEAEETPEFTKGLLLRLDFPGDGGAPGEVTIASLREAAGGKEGGLHFVDFESGSAKAVLRFQDPAQAAAVLEKGLSSVPGEPSLALLEGL